MHCWYSIVAADTFNHRLLSTMLHDRWRSWTALALARRRRGRDWKGKLESRAQAYCQWSPSGPPEAAANRSQHVQVEIWPLPSRPKRYPINGMDSPLRTPVTWQPHSHQVDPKQALRAGPLGSRLRESGLYSRPRGPRAIPCGGRMRSGRTTRASIIRVLGALVVGRSHCLLQDNQADSDCEWPYGRQAGRMDRLAKQAAGRQPREKPCGYSKSRRHPWKALSWKVDGCTGCMASLAHQHRPDCRGRWTAVTAVPPWSPRSPWLLLVVVGFAIIAKIY